MDTVFSWVPIAFFCAGLGLLGTHRHNWWFAAFAAGTAVSTAYDISHGRSLWWDLGLLVLLLINVAAALWSNRRRAAREAVKDAS